MLGDDSLPSVYASNGKNVAHSSPWHGTSGHQICSSLDVETRSIS
jgi:hypothetical protein